MYFCHDIDVDIDDDDDVNDHLPGVYGQVVHGSCNPRSPGASVS